MRKLSFEKGREEIEKIIDVYKRGNIGIDDLVRDINKVYKRIDSSL